VRAVSQPANEGVKRIPIGLAELFKRVTRSRRVVPRREHDAPVRRAEITVSHRRMRLLVGTTCHWELNLSLANGRRDDDKMQHLILLVDLVLFPRAATLLRDKGN
jgi:hypothetical protein